MLYRDAFRRLLRDRMVFACMVTIVVCMLLAILSLFPGIVGHPNSGREGQNPTSKLAWSYHPPTPLLALGFDVGIKAEDRIIQPDGSPPIIDGLPEAYKGGLFSAAAWELPLGADQAGRNVLGMALIGMRWAFIIGFLTTIISIMIAVPLGALAGYFGGWVDDIIVWFYTTVASIPFLLLLIAIISTIPDSARNQYGMLAVLFVIGVVTWVSLARLIRGEFLKHKQREYVQACRGLGYSNARIIFNHILPNVSHIIIITFTIGFISSVSIEVFLTFVGVGAGKGDMTWGTMITNAKTELTRQPSVWWPLATATTMLFVLSLAFSIFGDALRDALDPKLKH
jgi:ABC-type dipeptide/oligopeptide/nickel transport system permease subunit